MKKRTISKLIAGAAMAAALFIGSAGTAVATVSAAEDAGQATTVETTDDSTSVKANYHNTIKLVSLNGSSKVANSNVGCYLYKGEERPALQAGEDKSYGSKAT